MSLTTHSAFYYGHDVDSTNNLIDFNEGSGELTATIAIGNYTLTDFAAAVESAMNTAGTFTYTVTVNRTNRKLTIATSDGNFSLLASTGTSTASGAWSLMGFNPTDKTGAMTYTSDSGSGSSYTTQFILQDYIASSDWQGSSNVTVNKPASGNRVEVIKFGDENFMQCEFKFITDITQPSGGPVRNRASGVSDFRTFVRQLINKTPIEFMPDEATPSTYEKMLLESTTASKDGVAYKLRERYDIGLPGYYDSGVMVFRVID
jgi:hypothetical protein